MSNWLRIHGATSQWVQAELGLQPVGARSARPDGPLACVSYEDGCLLVQDSASDPVEDTFDLAKLSVGCTVVGVGEVDGAGGAEVVVWWNGRKLWGIEASGDEDGPELDGDVPASVLDAVERDARSGLEDEDDGDPDYFNAILHLATQMTGYSCGYGIDHPDEEPFEMLQPAGEAAVWERFPFALAEAMVNRGLRGKPSQSEDGYAFTAETDVPGMSVVVRIGMNHGRFGGIEIRGSVSLWSAGVAELLPTLEGTDSAQGNSLRDPGECARSPFHRDGRSAYADTHVMWDSDGIAGGVQWVCDHLDGRIASWLAEHSSLDRLIEAAKSANSDSGWRPSGPSVEMNPTIVLCILNHRYAEAADLMAGALEQSQDRPRAHGRAVSIDNGLAERCPEYAAARSL